MTLAVERLCARIAALPPVLAAAVAKPSAAEVDVEAVIADLFRDRATRPLAPDELAALVPRRGGPDAKAASVHRALVLVASWLLYEPAFRGADAARLAALLGARLGELSKLVALRAFVEDADRREELVRVCLDALGLAPDGERPADAEDRLATLDSARRTRLMREAKAREAEREKRRRELEELRRQEAEREAARVTHED